MHAKECSMLVTIWGGPVNMQVAIYSDLTRYVYYQASAHPPSMMILQMEFLCPSFSKNQLRMKLEESSLRILPLLDSWPQQDGG